MLIVKSYRNTPLKRSSRHTKVLKARLDKVVDHFVDAGSGLQEGAALQQLLHGLGVFGQAEEVGLLLLIMHGAAAVGTLAVHQLALGPEALARRAGCIQRNKSQYRTFY